MLTTAALALTDPSPRRPVDCSPRPSPIQPRRSYPFDMARVALAHGMWLRRRRSATDARRALHRAVDLFDSLSAGPWSARARHELGLTGAPAADRGAGWRR